jgi:hypothetical protein
MQLRGNAGLVAPYRGYAALRLVSCCCDKTGSVPGPPACLVPLAPSVSLRGSCIDTPRKPERSSATGCSRSRAPSSAHGTDAASGTSGATVGAARAAPLKRTARPDINTAAGSLVSVLSHCLAPPIIWQTIAVGLGDVSWAQAINAGRSLSDLVHLTGRDFETGSIPSRITCLGFVC